MISLFLQWVRKLPKIKRHIKSSFLKLLQQQLYNNPKPPPKMYIHLMSLYPLLTPFTLFGFSSSYPTSATIGQYYILNRSENATHDLFAIYIQNYTIKNANESVS